MCDTGEDMTAESGSGYGTTRDSAVSGDHMLRWPFGIWDGMPALIGSQVRM